MTIDITKIQGILEQLSTVHNNRPDTKLSVIQYTVAKALAFDAPIPTQVVFSPRSYYLENIARPLEAQLSAVNEVVVLNFTVAAEMAYRIWLARYKLVFDPQASDDVQLYKVLNGKSILDAATQEGFNRSEQNVNCDIDYVVKQLVGLFTLDEVPLV